LRNLLYIAHPLRQVASELFFQHVFLHFVSKETTAVNKELIEWHSRRTIEIITRISRDDSFANRLRTLKVHALNKNYPRYCSVEIDFQISKYHSDFTCLLSHPF
jgi:hypothetical protein